MIRLYILLLALVAMFIHGQYIGPWLYAMNRPLLDAVSSWVMILLVVFVVASICYAFFD